MSDWKAVVGRITLIPMAPGFSTDISAHLLYSQVWGSAPEGFQNPSNPLAPSVAQGRRGPLALACSVQRNRIDFNLSPAGDPDIASSRLEVLLVEDSRMLVAEYKSLIAAIGRLALQSVSRVALYGQFLVLGDTRANVNSILPAVIPSRYGLREIDGEDFILQLNKPQPSKSVQNLILNLVTKWSVDRIRVLKLLIDASAGAAAPRTEQADTLAASVSFDLSSAPRDGQLTPEEQSAILLELLSCMALVQAEIGLNMGGFKDV